MEPGTYQICITFDTDDADTAIALHNLIADIAPWMVDNIELLIEQVSV
jgi:hypothetical protein